MLSTEISRGPGMLELKRHRLTARIFSVSPDIPFDGNKFPLVVMVFSVTLAKVGASSDAHVEQRGQEGPGQAFWRNALNPKDVKPSSVSSANKTT